MRLCSRRLSSSLSFAAGLDPVKLSKTHPVTLSNFVDGQFSPTASYHDVIDPLNGEAFIRMPRTSVAELEPFISSLKRVPKSGLHNPFKHPEKYVQWGEVKKKGGKKRERERKQMRDFFFFFFFFFFLFFFSGVWSCC